MSAIACQAGAWRVDLSGISRSIPGALGMKRAYQITRVQSYWYLGDFQVPSLATRSALIQPRADKAIVVLDRLRCITISANWI